MYIIKDKEKNLRYIKRFSKITVSSICKELNINRANVLNGKASAKNIEKVKRKIEEKIKDMEG